MGSPFRTWFCQISAFEIMVQIVLFSLPYLCDNTTFLLSQWDKISTAQMVIQIGEKKTDFFLLMVTTWMPTFQPIFQGNWGINVSHQCSTIFPSNLITWHTLPDLCVEYFKWFKLEKFSWHQRQIVLTWDVVLCRFNLARWIGSESPQISFCCL